MLLLAAGVANCFPTAPGSVGSAAGNVTNPNQFHNESDLVVVPPSQNCPTGAAFVAFNDLTSPNTPNQRANLNVARTLTPAACLPALQLGAVWEDFTP